jgi:hypothetical protein
MSKLGNLAVGVVVLAAMWAGNEFLGLPVGGSVASILGTDKPSAGECATEFEDDVRSSVPQYASFLRGRELRRAAEDFCAEWITRPGSDHLTQESGPVFVREMFIEKPRLYRAVCNEIVAADLVASRAELAYVTTAELRGYRRDFCRLSVQYLHKDQPTVDLRALLHDHPTLWSPLCASGIQTEATSDPVVRQTFTKHQLATISRRACTKAVRTGVIDVSGPRGFLDARIDEAAFERIFVRIARDVALGH